MNNNFEIPARCTTKSVNIALEKAGYNLSIFRDAYNDGRYCFQAVIGEGNAATTVGTMAPWTVDTARAAAEYIQDRQDDLNRAAAHWGASIFRR